MTFVITVVNLKGGAAKTTTAMGLARAAAYGGSTAVIDADPMGAAFDWAGQAQRSGQALPFDVHQQPSADLPRLVRRDFGRYAVVIIDAPPPGNLQVARAAIQAAAPDPAQPGSGGVVVIPSPPDLADLARIPATRAEVDHRGIPSGVVLTKVRQGLPDADNARGGLVAAGVHVFGSVLPLTVAISRMYGQQVTGPLALYGIALMGEILDLKEGQPNG